MRTQLNRKKYIIFFFFEQFDDIFYPLFELRNKKIKTENKSRNVRISYIHSWNLFSVPLRYNQLV